ncbi:hypothetical protein MFIFM68171_09752 [Madurella fahalii]|uniref:Uncharacterized protein n=1 Tax=Madurella fahalii TaxID=1157608 RepID=A0ABQ0GP84_9PEZI
MFDMCSPAIPLPHVVPHQGGYRDFVPPRNQIDARTRPPRTCMLEDLAFYLEQHPTLFGPASTGGADGGDESMERAIRLVYRIVASHYRLQVGFLNALISHVQHSLSRHDKLDVFSPAIVKKQWSDVQAYERRVAYISLDLEAIILQCRGTTSIATAGDKADEDGIVKEFHFIHTAVRNVGHRVGLLGSAVTGLAGIVGNRQAVEEQMLSRQEATSVKALTVVGLVFLPLGLASSLFSLTSAALPRIFWPVGVYV